MEPIESVAVELSTHCLVAPITLVVIIFKKLIVVSVRVVFVDGTGAGR